jgi:hypothetical protein
MLVIRAEKVLASLTANKQILIKKVRKGSQAVLLNRLQSVIWTLVSDDRTVNQIFSTLVESKFKISKNDLVNYLHVLESEKFITFKNKR